MSKMIYKVVRGWTSERSLPVQNFVECHPVANLVFQLSWQNQIWQFTVPTHHPTPSLPLPKGTPQFLEKRNASFNEKKNKEYEVLSYLSPCFADVTNMG